MASGVDIIARGLGAKGLQEADRANARLDALPKGLVYRGAVNYYSDLPSGAEVGDVYTVKYEGTSGTTPNGDEYAWGVYESTNQWIKIGKDYESLAPEEGGVAVSLVTTGEKYFWNSREIFVATDQTTYNEITQALSDGKIVFANVLGKYWLLTNSDNHNYEFTLMQGGQYLLRTRINDTTGWWGYYSNTEVEKLSNKVTSISSASTDTQFPSAKCIYDELTGKQDVLVNQENIKSINGNSLLGSGNLAVRTYQAFSAGWTTNSTTTAFCAAVNGDSSAVEGMAYLGELRCSDLPGNLVNGEAIVEVISGSGTSGKVLHIVLTSGDTNPYRWEYTYWNNGGRVSGWIGYQTQLATQPVYTAKGSPTKVPQITTNNLGQVTNITEVTIEDTGITNNEVIERVNNMPVATDLSPDFIQYNGKLYKKKVSGGSAGVITDLTNTTWTFKNSCNYYGDGLSSNNFSINFTTSSTNFQTVRTLLITPYYDNGTIILTISFENGQDGIYVKTTDALYSMQSLTDGEGWYGFDSNQHMVKMTALPIIQITGGVDVTNSDLISWLQANADMQTTTTYEYKIIDEVAVSDSGTATDEIQYITINGVEKKIAGGAGGIANGVAYEIL